MDKDKLYKSLINNYTTHTLIENIDNDNQRELIEKLSVGFDNYDYRNTRMLVIEVDANRISKAYKTYGKELVNEFEDEDEDLFKFKLNNDLGDYIKGLMYLKYLEIDNQEDSKKYDVLKKAVNNFEQGQVEELEKENGFYEAFNMDYNIGGNCDFGVFVIKNGEKIKDNFVQKHINDNLWNLKNENYSIKFLTSSMVKTMSTTNGFELIKNRDIPCFNFKENEIEK